MSLVWSVTLICSCAEHDEEPEDVIAFLGESDKGETFKEVSSHFGGGKAAEIWVFGAAFNYIDDDWLAALVGRVLMRRWRCPQDVVLIISPPDDQPSTVLRPSYQKA